MSAVLPSLSRFTCFLLDILTVYNITVLIALCCFPSLRWMVSSNLSLSSSSVELGQLG